MPSKRWLNLGLSLVVAAVNLVFAVAVIVALASPAGASTGAVVRPVILRIQATSRSLPDTGGVVHFTVKLRRANTCKLEVTGTPAVVIAFSKAWQRCSNGIFRHSVTFGANSGQTARNVVFRAYLRRGTEIYWYPLGSVRVDGEPSAPAPPSAPTASLTISTDTISSAGGSITLTYSSKNASSCTLASTPSFWTGSNPATVNCNGTYQATVPSTSVQGEWFFTFTATNAAGQSASATQTLTEQAPPVTVTGTTVATTLTSSAQNGSSSSLTVDYTASLTATCTYSDGASGACTVPTGTVSYEFDGADNGGNLTYLSSAVSNCTTAVGGTTNVSSCNVTWGTYGDQWITTTYTSSSAPTVLQTVGVEIVAPVDLAAGNSYSTYGNVGPGAVGDCTMASVADWIATTFGTAPSDQSTVSAYWAAEDEYNGGADVGLTPGQLFAFWTNTGIDGTYLTGDNPVTGQSEVESMLSNQYVLMAAENLPLGFPPGGGAVGGGHMWLVVGYGDYGPMIVSWGQEFQINWAEFSSWTTGVWSIGATSP